mgnify:CR=1 FL=1
MVVAFVKRRGIKDMVEEKINLSQNLSLKMQYKNLWNTKDSGIKTVFLAGGLESGWQDKVKDYFKDLPNIEFFDPRYNGTCVPDDFAGIAGSDIVFCYIEKENKSGVGAISEMTYAHMLGISTLLVNEHDYIHPFFCYLSRWIYTDFNKGLETLRKYLIEENVCN